MRLMLQLYGNIIITEEFSPSAEFNGFSFTIIQDLDFEISLDGTSVINDIGDLTTHNWSLEVIKPNPAVNRIRIIMEQCIKRGLTHKPIQMSIIPYAVKMQEVI